MPHSAFPTTLSDVPVDALRARAEQAIEHLLGLLDDLDGDPDVEGTYHGHGYGTTSKDDEPDDTGIADQDGLAEQTDGEPSLGAAEPGYYFAAADQTFWAIGGLDDLEDDPADGPQLDDADRGEPEDYL